MKVVLGAAALFLWMFMVPAFVGSLAAAGFQKANRRRSAEKPVFAWVMGQLLLWAGFQLISVPLILMKKPFMAERENGEWLGVTELFFLYAAVLAAAGLVILVYGYRKRRTLQMAVSGERGVSETVLWICFWGLLAFQLVQAVRLAYGDGDDAYYVEVSTVTQESNGMYLKAPYTGGTTQLDIRHGLAPFPVWIAFLAKMSGLPAVSVAHVAVPLMLIPMTYAIFYLVGRKLCERKMPEKLPLFLVLTELLVLFGDYSIYTAETFMLARSRQGKAALGSIVFPALFYLLLLLLERLQENKRIEWMLWILLTAANLSGCLCSALGAFLVCLFVGVTGLCAAVCYRRWKVLIPMALSCSPAAAFALLYLLS